MAVLSEVYVPKETVSDEFATVIKIYVDNGDSLKKGDILIDLETSKSIITVEAECDGYAQISCQEGKDVEINSLLMKINDTLDFMNDIEASNLLENDTESSSDTDILFSKSALELIAKYNISKTKFNDYDFVSKNDVMNIYNSELKMTLELIDDVYKEDVENLLLIGIGGHSKCLQEIIETDESINIVGFINAHNQLGESYNGYKIVSLSQELDVLQKIKDEYSDISIVIGFGHINEKLVSMRETLIKDLIKTGISAKNVIHNSSIIEKSVSIGKGNQIFANTVLSTSVTLGDFNIINTSATISHDCKIGNNSHIAPGAVLGGGVTIGDNVIIGMNSTIFAGVTIPDNTIIGNNQSVLPKDFD